MLGQVQGEQSITYRCEFFQQVQHLHFVENVEHWLNKLDLLLINFSRQVSSSFLNNLAYLRLIAGGKRRQI